MPGSKIPSTAPNPVSEVLWISGWGVNPERLRPLTAAFPKANHRFVPPVRGVAELAARSDCVVAWSLGAWRVLEAAARGVVFRGRVRLLAPFVAFCSEYGAGGRCSLSQVRWLRRWLQRDPVAALADFSQRAGLGSAPAAAPYALSDLLEGLDRLAEEAPASLRAFAARGLAPQWQAVIGAADPLLDARIVQRFLPGCRVLPETGHAAEELIRALETMPDAV